MVASNIAVISPPEKPFSPFSPQKRYNIMIGVLIGLLGGIGLAYLSEYFDDSIKTSEELERVCRFPTLGVVPLQHEQHKGERPKVSETALLTLTQTDCMLSEAIRHVRTSVMFSSSGGPPEVIMVTSPNPSEGKTTVSINLAVSLALSGAKVALMDADLRNPTLHRVFQQPLHPGLTNYITGAASPEEIRRVTEIPNLTIISAGNSPPNPGELLSSKMVEDFITSIRKDFDHVIIDTPPIIGFADGRNLSTLTDGVIVIIKHHSTTREAGRLAKKLLSAVNARVIGGVLNMTVSNKLGYGSYYGYYKYYYKAYGKYNKNNTERLES
jgi:capsular exopolysaccharide synthesis family protein